LAHHTWHLSVQREKSFLSYFLLIAKESTDCSKVRNNQQNREMQSKKRNAKHQMPNVKCKV